MLLNQRVMTSIPDNEAVSQPANFARHSRRVAAMGFLVLPANAGAEVSGHSTNN